MSVLAVSVGRAGVVAVIDGSPPVPVLLPPGPAVPRSGTGRGGVGWEAADVWRAVIDAVGAAVRASGVAPTGLALTVTAPTTAVWDAESLGASRPVVPQPYGEALAAVRDNEPHVWALLVSGRYAVGDLPGYLVARMTRGVWLVAADPVTLPADLAAGLPAGVLPAGAEPWPGPGHVRTDPGAFAGLDLPVVALAAVDADDIA